MTRKSQIRRMDVRPEHPAKADEPIAVTESGTRIVRRPEQLKKAFSPIEVTVESIVSEDSCERLYKA